MVSRPQDLEHTKLIIEVSCKSLCIFYTTVIIFNEHDCKYDRVSLEVISNSETPTRCGVNKSRNECCHSPTSVPTVHHFNSDLPACGKTIVLATRDKSLKNTSHISPNVIWSHGCIRQVSDSDTVSWRFNLVVAEKEVH